MFFSPEEYPLFQKQFTTLFWNRILNTEIPLRQSKNFLFELSSKELFGPWAFQQSFCNYLHVSCCFSMYQYQNLKRVKSEVVKFQGITRLLLQLMTVPRQAPKRSCSFHHGLFQLPHLSFSAQLFHLRWHYICEFFPISLSAFVLSLSSSPTTSSFPFIECSRYIYLSPSPNLGHFVASCFNVD